MHLTRTIPSAKIVDDGELSYTRIAPSSFGGILGTGLYRHVRFSVSGDVRLQRLIDQVGAEMRKNRWSPRGNEREICERVVWLMSSDKYFGPYDTNTKPGTQEFDDKDAVARLKDLKTGQLHCKEQAIVVSVVLHQSGIPNDFCVGPTLIEGRVKGHAFVQTHTGNVVESSNPFFSFMRTLNGKMVRDGKIALVESVGRVRQCYGAGNIPLLEGIKYTLSSTKLGYIENALLTASSHERSSDSRPKGQRR